MCKKKSVWDVGPSFWMKSWSKRIRHIGISHKLLHITKFTHTINGCCAPNAGLQLSCPRCMASLSEPNICCTSASKPGGGKRGRLGGSLHSNLTCSCNTQLLDITSPAAASIVAVAGREKQHSCCLGGFNDSNH